jgi:hypothetical protein
MSIAGVTRELLVRYLDAWAPAALHGAKRATFAMAWAGEPDADTAEAAVRVFAEFADRLRGRRLAVVLLAPGAAALAARLPDVPSELSVHAVDGGPELLAVALKAAGAAAAPILVYADTDGEPPLAPVAAGKPGEVLLGTPAGGWDDRRKTLRDNGFPLTSGVELVESGQARLLTFATTSAKHMEAYKDELWAVDEYAGVRYRDPTDPGHDTVDISLRPNPGPLRRELLAHLASEGERTVTQLRHFTLTETIFRASDAVRAITALVAAGSVVRTPPGGRLSGDVLIRVS